MPHRGDTYHIGELCPESGVYRLKDDQCVSEQQREIPLAKGHKFPPCRSCDKKVVWEYVRRA